MHSDLKPFVCDVCKMAFARSGDLDKHKIVHTEENPYLCEICKKKFSQISNFVRHKRMHMKKIYHCEHCQKSF